MISSPMNGKKVLVVEDETDLRSALLFDFERRGCVIFEAGSGSEAMEIVRQHNVDIVLSDIQMPNGTGIDLLKYVRGQHPTKPVFLFATGYANFTREQALEMGACDLIDKPIDRKLMLGAIEKAILDLGDASKS